MKECWRRLWESKNRDDLEYADKVGYTKCDMAMKSLDDHIAITLVYAAASRVLPAIALLWLASPSGMNAWANVQMKSPQNTI